MKDHLFIAKGTGKICNLKKYDNYEFTANYGKWGLYGFTIKFKNNKKSKSISLPKLKNEQINALLSKLDNDYYGKQSHPTFYNTYEHWKEMKNVSKKK